MEITLDKKYKELLKEIKDKVRNSQIRASLSVNSEVIQLYWDIGRRISESQKAAKWGDKILETLSHDLQNQFPKMQGFSPRNLKFMCQFNKLYPESIGKRVVSQIPWGHIITLMQKVKNEEEREWYSGQIIEFGWSRPILVMQIETNLYKRQGNNNKKISNYTKQLPPPQSDLANGMLKDPFNFDFLTIRENAREKEVEKGLIRHMKDFLLELGQGFAFVGSQYPVEVGGETFLIDLLFYHLNLRAFIVVELKVVPFSPEFVGKLGFYLAAVDNKLKHNTDNQTIGILLCKSKNNAIAEYALQLINAPVGVAEYTLSHELPEEFKNILPSIEKLEDELNTIENEEDK